MKNKLSFLLVFAAAAFLARGAAFALDFSALSGPRPFAEVRVPAAPAPAPAQQGCRPFLMSVSVGGVSETVILERACTPGNEPVWALAVEISGRRPVSVKVSSADHPAEKAVLEKRIKNMVVNGLSQEDADFIVQVTGPELRGVLAAPAGEQPALLARAEAALKAYLARP